jgi:hypothetical protein
MVNGALSFEKRTRKPRRALCYDDFAVPVGASAKCLVVSPWYEVYRRRRRSQTLRATEGLSEPNGVTLAPALLARTDEVTEGKERLAGLARSNLRSLAVKSVRFSACIFISTAPTRR